MKVYVGLSYNRDHETEVIGASESREGARRLVEQARNELLYFAKEATDGPDGGAALDDFHGDMVGHVLAYDVFGEANLEWLYDSPDDCLSAKSSTGETYCVTNVDTGKWEASIADRVLGDGPLEECLIMCRMTEDKAIREGARKIPLLTDDPADAISAAEELGIYAVPCMHGKTRYWKPRMPSGHDPDLGWLLGNQPTHTGWHTWAGAVLALAEYLRSDISVC